MVAQVIESPKKLRLISHRALLPFLPLLKDIEIANYPKQEFIAIKKEMLPAISVANKPNEIQNKDAIVFPENIEDIRSPLNKRPNFSEDEEKISFIRSRKDESEQIQEKTGYAGEDDDEESILINKLREFVIRFDKLLTKFLDPDIPTGRKAKKKFYEEREMFRASGYKDFINTIDLKVEALCSFENYDKTQFCKKTDDNWFKGRIKQALNGDFYSAQEVVNSVMQIVKEEEYAVPKRRIVAKLR